jgi:hypothetical protein
MRTHPENRRNETEMELVKKQRPLADSQGDAIKRRCEFCNKHPRVVGTACVTCLLWIVSAPESAIANPTQIYHEPDTFHVFHQLVELLGLTLEDIDQEVIVEQIARTIGKRASEMRPPRGRNER